MALVPELMRDIIILILIAVVLAMSFLLADDAMPVPVDNTRHILDSVRYEQRMDSMSRLVEAQRVKIEALRHRGKRLTLQLDSLSHAIRHRPPSRLTDDDSLRAAILRAAGQLHHR